MNDHIDDLPERPLTHEVNITTPGAILLAARQTRGIEIAEVARKLKLSKQKVIDIEADHLQDHSALVYVRGYIRSYAQLLGINPDTVIAAFDKMVKPKKTVPVVPVQEERGSIINQPIIERIRSHRNSKRFVRWGGITLGIIMVLLVIIWWNDQRHQTSAAPATVALPATSLTQTTTDESSELNRADAIKALSQTNVPALAQPAQTNAQQRETKPKVVQQAAKSTPLKANYSVVKLDD